MKETVGSQKRKRCFLCFFAKMCLVAPYSDRIFDNHQLWKAPSLEQQILRHLSHEKKPSYTRED